MDSYNYILTSDGELYHFGVKGMKWGVRRYQNKDGSLTPRGKKKYSEAYKKLAIETQKEQGRVNQKLMIDSYNRTADEYNRYKIAEYNKKYSPDDPKYEERYESQFADDWKRNYTISYLEFTKSSKSYQKGKALADKYKLYEFDQLAKSNKETVETMEKYVNGLLSYEQLDRVVMEERSKLK